MLSDNGGSGTIQRDASILTLRTKAELAKYVCELFAREGSADRVGIPRERLYAFAATVGRRYRDNPYHNFHHAVDTVNTMAWMITRPRLVRDLPAERRFLLLLTALVHDVDHPGHNNQFEVDNHTDLARKYQNNAVLERHSLDVTLALLDQPELNLFAHLEPARALAWREILAEQVLATDFQAHRAFMDGYTAYLEQHEIDFADPEFLSWLCRGLIKAADIANTSKPFPEAKRWGRRVMMEFWAQGVLEKERNLPVGPFNDPDKVKMNAAQAGFIKFAAMELFEQLGEVDPALREMVDNLSANLERYEAMAQNESLFE